jgi:hypothetical protein
MLKGEKRKAYMKEYMKVYYEINKDILRAKALEYYRENPERYRQYTKAWYGKNKERLKDERWENRKDKNLKMQRFQKGKTRLKAPSVIKEIKETAIRLERSNLRMTDEQYQNYFNNQNYRRS